MKIDNKQSQQQELRLKFHYSHRYNDSILLSITMNTKLPIFIASKHQRIKLSQKEEKVDKNSIDPLFKAMRFSARK